MRPRGLEKTGGRKSGTPNKITSDLRKAVSVLIEDNWSRIQDDLNALDPKDRLIFIEKLLSYSLPKLSSVTQETTLKSTLEQLSDAQLQQMAEMILNKQEQYRQEKTDESNHG